LKRFSPAVLLALATACVMLLDAVVVVVPQALAAPRATEAVPARPFGAAAALYADPSADPSAEATFGMSMGEVPAPGTSPSPTAAPPTATPIPTKAPVAKVAPKPKYRDTVANARLYVKSRIGTTQYNCINILWYHESRWSWRASNPNSGAYGIPQAVPGSKMAVYGANWRTSPLTQVKWGIWYVNNRYGSACGAYAFWKAHGWY
jgi:hypothetical protein